MINIYKVKKYGALITAVSIGSLLTTIGLLWYGIWGGVIFFLCAILCAVGIGVVLLNNPFSAMLEGKGILALNIDSTGIIRPFLINVDNPFIRGKLFKQEVHDVFNREAVHSLAVPRYAKQKEKDGKKYISLSEEDYNASRFGMDHYPVILYNSNIQSIMTKEFLSEKEKEAFAEHGLLYANRRLEELTGAVRDFGRHVVELTKPGSDWYTSWWFYAIIVVFIIIMLVLFGQPILNAVSGFSSPAAEAVSQATAGSSPVSPR